MRLHCSSPDSLSLIRSGFAIRLANRITAGIQKLHLKSAPSCLAMAIYRYLQFYPAIYASSSGLEGLFSLRCTFVNGVCRPPNSGPCRTPPNHRHRSPSSDVVWHSGRHHSQNSDVIAAICRIFSFGTPVKQAGVFVVIFLQKIISNCLHNTYLFPLKSFICRIGTHAFL